MHPKFEVIPKIGVGPVKLGVTRASVIESMGVEPKSFMKSPMSAHPTDSFFDAGFQIFYDGEPPKVESIELSRGCGFEICFSGCKILDFPVQDALIKLESITGYKPETEDHGYSYEIPELGLWVWRQSNEENDDESLYFATIGVGKTNT